MQDSDYGVRDARGHWSPFKAIAYPPVFVWPPVLTQLARWFWRDYLLSWNLFFAGVAVLVWLFATPAFAEPGFADFILLWLRNAGLVLAFFAGWHWVLRRQGTSFKFNPAWPDRPSARFLFGTQLRENLFWTFASGVTIGTLLEGGLLWLWASGALPWIGWADSPVYLVILMLLVPVWRDLHFYCIHRLIHWPPLYARIHSLHHKNINPTPWSGLAMHPGEHLLYYSGPLIHFLVPAHPVVAIFQFVHLHLSPAPGHSGFDKVELGDKRLMETHAYAHYLHHKYFECNYADGVIPLDKWFGSFCDGTPEGIAAFKERRRA